MKQIAYYIDEGGLRIPVGGGGGPRYESVAFAQKLTDFEQAVKWETADGSQARERFSRLIARIRKNVLSLGVETAERNSLEKKLASELDRVQNERSFDDKSANRLSHLINDFVQDEQ